MTDMRWWCIAAEGGSCDDEIAKLTSGIAHIYSTATAFAAVDADGQLMACWGSASKTVLFHVLSVVGCCNLLGGWVGLLRSRRKLRRRKGRSHVRHCPHLLQSLCLCCRGWRRGPGGLLGASRYHCRDSFAWVGGSIAWGCVFGLVC